jgi:hypothetical protein
MWERRLEQPADTDSGSSFASDCSRGEFGSSKKTLFLPSLKMIKFAATYTSADAASTNESQFEIQGELLRFSLMRCASRAPPAGCVFVFGPFR